MSRSHGNPTNSGWQAQRPPSADPDPRAWSGSPQGQRPQQPTSPQMPQGGGYPSQRGAASSLTQESGYHYPQQAPAGPAAPKQEPYAASQAPYTQQPHATQAQRSGPDPTTGVASTPYPQAGQKPEAGPDLRGGNYEQWSIPAQGQDPRGYDLGGYMPVGGAHGQSSPHTPTDPLAHSDPLQAQQEWGQHAQQPAGYGDPAHEEAYQGGGQPGYEHGRAGALEQNYAQEDAEYEIEESRRGSWTMRIAGAVVVAVGVGFGLAQAYKLVVGSSPDGATPLITGDSGPSKTKPADPGGKKFAHTDSKIMGRLGESSSASDTDASGARKVQTLVVGRDGSIVPPVEPPAQTGSVTSSVSVPGMTVVDGFGGQFPRQANSAPARPPAVPAEPPAASAQIPIVVNPPPSAKKPVVIARTTEKKGDTDRAIADHTKAIAIDPEHANAYTNRGNAYASKGEIDRAIADFDKAIALNPEFVFAYNNRGLAYKKKGDKEQAIADFRKALEIDPSDQDAKNNLKRLGVTR